MVCLDPQFPRVAFMRTTLVSDKHHFEDGGRWYRFRIDDDTAVTDAAAQVTVMQGVQLYHRMKNSTPALIVDKVSVRFNE